MIEPHRTTRRGLSMLELIIALSVTALIGAATVGMLNAVSVGVDTRHDYRSVTIRSHHAQSRLAAYVTPGRCVLHRGNNALVLWFDDNRKNDMINISEVRWLVYDPDEGEIVVYYITYPNWMTETQKLIYDQRHRANSDWMELLETYQSHPRLGMGSTKLIDGLALAGARLDTGNDVLAARHVTFHLTFETRSGEYETIASAAIRNHAEPAY